MILPFGYDKVAAGSGILGRRSEIDIVASTLASGKSIAVIGAPRSGKETIVSEALSRLRARGEKSILCQMDFFNIRTKEDFYALWKKTMKEISGEANRNSLLPYDIDTEFVSDRQSLDLPQIIAEEASTAIIIYIKQFQNLLTFEDETFRLEDFDRSWSKHSRVRYIMTGSYINSMKYIFEERRLFYSMVRALEIKPLDKREVCEYITTAFLNVGRVIEAEEALEIYEIASGNIWYVNQICSFCYAMPAGYVNRKIVNQARDCLLAIHSPRFLQTMLDLTSNQINFLRAVVDGVQKFSSSEIMEKYRLNSSANVFRLKDALQKKEVITFTSEDDAIVIDPLFEYWLRNCYFAQI